MPPEVAAVFDAAPPAARARLHALRALIFETAEAEGAGPLTEALRWGEPAYLTEATKSGSTIRLGWRPADPDAVYVYVICRTDLVARMRTLLAERLEFVGSRAIRVPLDPPPDEGDLRTCIALALTYKRRRAAGA